MPSVIRAARPLGLPIPRAAWLATLVLAVAGGHGRAQAAGPDIVVSSGHDKPSGWKRAETEHLVVFSAGGEGELKRVSANLERLHGLMLRLYRPDNAPEEALKLRVVLYDSANFFKDMGLRNLRSQEGPYALDFGSQRYYDPREDGAVLAVARVDQVVRLDTFRSRDKDCEDTAEAGADCIGLRSLQLPPVARHWEAALYSAYAQHFMLSYLPAGYPRWYLDGVGALFSTLEVHGDGSVDYAGAPEGYKLIFRSYGTPAVADVLTGRYLETPSAKMEWTPFHAWLLAHYFLYSNLRPERLAQFSRYMAAVHQGRPMAEAAKVFGSLVQLHRELADYAERRGLSFARTAPMPSAGAEPVITSLSAASAAMLDAGVELEAHLVPAADAGLAGWMAGVRQTIARWPFDADAVLLLAQAECRSGQVQPCLADAERVLAQAPDNAVALAWKGVALTGAAIEGPEAARGAALEQARQPLERAIRLDSDATMPLIAYFESFTRAGQRAPDGAVAAMVKAIRMVPAAPAPRLALGEELMRQGKQELARRVMYPVLHGPYASPEKAEAEAVFAH